MARLTRRHHASQRVAVEAGGGVDTDRAGKTRAVMPCILQRMPGALQEQPLLRIHRLGIGG